MWQLLCLFLSVWMIAIRKSVIFNTKLKTEFGSEKRKDFFAFLKLKFGFFK